MPRQQLSINLAFTVHFNHIKISNVVRCQLDLKQLIIQDCTRKTKLHGYVPMLWFNYFILGLNFIFFVSGYGNV